MLRSTTLFLLAAAIPLTIPFPASAQRAGAPPKPATRPAFGKPTTPEAQVRAAFLGLMSPDAVVRGRAYDQLLRLSRNDLPTLAAVAREFRPLPPTLASVLKPIVVQVHASGEPYEKESIAFLGVRLATDAANPELAVVIEARMLGFVGARVLQDGDAILDIEEQPLPEDRTIEQFQEAIRQCRPGKTIHLKVLRRGEIIRVPATLDARPLDKSNGDPTEYSAQVDELIYTRNNNAEAFWANTFAPLTQPPERNPSAAAR